MMPNEILVPFIVFCGSLIYGTFGFGDAMFAMPFLSMLIGVKTATPLMTLNGCTMAAILFIKHYKDIDWKRAKWLIFSSLYGIPFGIYFLKNGNEFYTKIILGLIISSVAIYNLFLKKSNLPHNTIHKNWVFFFGFSAGVLGGAFNTGGPSIVIFGTLSGWSQIQFISTLQGYFFPSDLCIIIGHIYSGLLTKTVLHYYLLSLPFLFLAVYIGHKIRQLIPEHKFVKYVFVILFIVGVFFLIHSILLLQS